ncbi:hypothetical protein [Aquimarina sp. AU474]|uniref:hypothetical protein n=1 Tax=Aquimarina sp. AU474 TaxID=2108529 RepID=UPI000D6881F7|nr:hypothetical protein [Aquimarina sp. AU474]
MKKIVVFGLMFITLWACQKENDSIIPETVQEIFLEDQDSQTSIKGPSGRLCRFTFEYGTRVCDPLTGECDCDDSSADICGLSLQCYPDPFAEINLPPVLWDPCKIIPCGWNYRDPWIIYDKVKPEKFGSIKEYLQLGIDQPTAQAIPFVMNEEILALQFYQPNHLMSGYNLGDPTPQPNKVYLKNTLVLSTAFAKNMGLKGKVIKAGKYPVIFNKKNNTYNVILKVK